MKQESNPIFEENSTNSREPGESIAPLGYLPLTGTRPRMEGENRARPGFLSQLVEDFLGAEKPQKKPVLVAVEGHEILVDETSKPLQLSDSLIKADALRQWVAEPQRQADVIFIGRTREGSAVLALTGNWEYFCDFKTEHLNLLGPDGEQRVPRDVLASHAEGHWQPARELAEEVANSQDAELKIWLELASAAVALNNWHRGAAYDPATGQETVVAQAGWSRVNSAGREIFPRTDPAVITAVTATFDGEERILLGQARAWGKNRFSTFAGFIEAGESAENAVQRELLEECNGEVDSLQYLGSQPWPFPRSLMLGYRAEISNPHQVQADGEEIETVRWFTAHELKTAYSSGEIKLPSRASISRMLIENFLGEPLA